MRILTPLSGLNVYQWHTRTAKDFFCPTCGILPFRRPMALIGEELKQGMEPFPGWSVNVPCLESMPIRRIYGSKLP